MLRVLFRSMTKVVPPTNDGSKATPITFGHAKRDTVGARTESLWVLFSVYSVASGR